MDKLELKITDSKEDDLPFQTVTILINGKDLIELLKEYELPLAKGEGSENIAGGYSGLAPTELYKRLTNPGKYDIDQEDQVSILECECGCEGCWPMKVGIVESRNKIIWRNFSQPHRGPDSSPFWDYKAFGEFEFEKAMYLEQIQKLRI